MFVFHCVFCKATQEIRDRNNPPSCCGFVMRRDYRSESVSATFRGSGWARSQGRA